MRQYIDSDAEPLSSPHVKGSKDRFLERAETREAGENPLFAAIWATNLPFSPQPEPIGRRSMAESQAKCKGELGFELYFLLLPPSIFTIG